MANQKGFAGIYLVIGLIILCVLGGTYYSVKVSNKSLLPQLSAVPSATVQPIKSNEIVGWSTVQSIRCSINLKYPAGWVAEETELIAGTNNSDFQFGCVTIKTPDFQVFPNSDKKEGLDIQVSRTTKGYITFNKVKVDTVDDYITALEKMIQPSINLNSQEKDYGEIKGRYFEFPGQDLTSTFVAEKDNFIYAVTWRADYKGSYGSEVVKIISTLKFLDNNPEGLTCPLNGWKNCMPILTEEAKKGCGKEAIDWYKANCPNFQGIAR